MVNCSHDCDAAHVHTDTMELIERPENGLQDSVVDPVCGMNVSVGTGKPQYSHAGIDYHFCSQKCHSRFSADPYFYTSGDHLRKVADAPENALFTCPMDPEIIQEGPGACPICGMALEPMSGTSDEPNHELIDFTRRLWVVHWRRFLRFS